jgi:hypothetical protein
MGLVAVNINGVVAEGMLGWTATTKAVADQLHDRFPSDPPQSAIVGVRIGGEDLVMELPVPPIGRFVVAIQHVDHLSPVISLGLHRPT